MNDTSLTLNFRRPLAYIVKAATLFSASVAGLLLRAIIWLYRHTFSYFLGTQCRYLPTCSQYASEAICLHGPLKGSGLALKRICRCHPWGRDGFDPVPPRAK